VWTLVRGAKDVVAFLEDHGMKFREDEISAGIGGLWPRGIIPVDPRGTGYIKVLKQAADNLGVEILLETKMTEIIRETPLSGKILGVKAVDKEGKDITFKAKSVIIATGGFAGDADFRLKYDHRWTKDFHNRNYPGQTADALVIAADIGADRIGMDHIQLQVTAFDLKTQQPTTNLASAVEDQIYVNQRGERIVKSDARRDKIRDAIYEQPNHTAFRLCDERGRQRAKGIYPHRNISDREIDASLKSGKLFRGRTIRKVAEKAGVDPDGLENTVAKYNKYVDQGFDEKFGQKPIFLRFKLEKPPYYLWRISTAMHHTMGGLRINKKTQVLDRWGKVISGLYAAGEVTGGIHGSNRVGGNALLDIHVFGMIAGRNAAKEAQGLR